MKGMGVKKVKMMKTTKKKQLTKKQKSLSKAKLLPHSWQAVKTPLPSPQRQLYV